MKRTMMLLSLVLVFWNLENFFNPDSSAHPQKWTRAMFFTKCDAVAKTLFLIADEAGSPPDVIALCEIEDETVLSHLISTTALRKLGYDYVHYDSPDKRGIDCALLYRKHTLNYVESKAFHLYDSTGTIIPTRDILWVQFDSLDVIVNHHPSKLGGGADDRRVIALSALSHICDSLQSEGRTKIIALGDFNDTRSALSDSLMYPMRELASPDDMGTIKYNGKWEQIDRAFSSPGLSAELYIEQNPVLLTRDLPYGGKKPLRTFSGPRYLGGVSDHLPIFVIFAQDK